MTNPVCFGVWLTPGQSRGVETLSDVVFVVTTKGALSTTEPLSVVKFSPGCQVCQVHCHVMQGLVAV